MRKWLWIAPLLLVVAGCSKSRASQQPQAPQTAGGSAPTALATLPDNPEPIAAPEPAPPPPEVIPGGTPLRVRIDEPISTRRNMPGDRFTATLTNPVVVDGQAVLPAGTRMAGRVMVSAPSGRFRGRARLVLVLDSFQRDGRRYRIDTTAAAHIRSGTWWPSAEAPAWARRSAPSPAAARGR
jgi:hypothetical protein